MGLLYILILRMASPKEILTEFKRIFKSSGSDITNDKFSTFIDLLSIDNKISDEEAEELLTIIPIFNSKNSSKNSKLFRLNKDEFNTPTKFIGKGASGEVFVNNTERKEYTYKLVDYTDCFRDSNCKQQLTNFLTEVYIQVVLSLDTKFGSHIPKINGIYRSKDTNSLTRQRGTCNQFKFLISMDFIPFSFSGYLNHLVISEPQKLVGGKLNYGGTNKTDLALFYATIYDILEHFKEKYSFSHNDLHIGNVMVDITDDGVGHPIIIDFGRSIIQSWRFHPEKLGDLMWCVALKTERCVDVDSVKSLDFCMLITSILTNPALSFQYFTWEHCLTLAGLFRINRDDYNLENSLVFRSIWISIILGEAQPFYMFYPDVFSCIGRNLKGKAPKFIKDTVGYDALTFEKDARDVLGRLEMLDILDDSKYELFHSLTFLESTQKTMNNYNSFLSKMRSIVQNEDKLKCFDIDKRPEVQAIYLQSKVETSVHNKDLWNQVPKESLFGIKQGGTSHKYKKKGAQRRKTYRK